MPEPLAISSEVIQPSQPLRDAVDHLWAVFGSSSTVSSSTSSTTLLPTLAVDAVLARARSGEAAVCAPRLLELVSGLPAVCVSDVGVPALDVPVLDVFDVLDRWHDWSLEQRHAILGWADAWWITVLSDHPGHRLASDVLGELSCLGVPMVRWLMVWQDELDGPAVLHLADAVLDATETDAWDASDDERGQLVAWAKGETVVNGLMMVGGVHLPEGRLSDLFDALI